MTSMLLLPIAVGWACTPASDGPVDGVATDSDEAPRDTGVGTDTDLQDEGRPDCLRTAFMDVPATLPVLEVGRQATSTSVDVVIDNVCDVAVSRVTARAEPEVFAVTESDGLELIEPFGRGRTTVTFTPPGAGSFGGRLLLSADAQDELVIELHAQARRPALRLAPTELFLEGPVGCAIEGEFLVGNDAAEDVLDITEVSFSAESDALEADAPTDLPWALQPGETRSVQVTFYPAGDVLVDGNLFVFTGSDSLASAVVRARTRPDLECP